MEFVPRLLSLALECLLRSRGNERVVKQLNRAYGDEPHSSEERSAAAMQAKLRSRVRDQW
jgi:hypothetical protein